MRNSHWLKVTLFLFVFAWIGASTASAIEVYGRIRGVVTDPSGAMVAGATVTAINTETGIATKVDTATDGSYEFAQLPAPATYNLKCEKTGFKLFQATGVRLFVTQIYVQNITMELGAVTQTVTVEAAPVQVEKTSIQLGATLTSSQIVDLPLVGRNWVQLQQTLPGVVAQSNRIGGNYASNGSQPSQNSFLLNGIDTNDLPLNQAVFIPSPDSIAEVKMITNTINPEYGRNSGVIMNAVTKSGGNAFHGSGFEFYRDTSLNARNFFQPSPAVFHQHIFGGTVGGPIKKDKAFFFFSYQGTRNRAPGSGGNTTVFTQDQRNGAFPDVAASDTLSPFALTGEDGTVYPAGTPYSTIFPTGNIPTADFNSLAVDLMTKFVPLPNSGTEYQFNPVNTNKADQFMSRVDYNLTDKDTMWGSWMYEKHPTISDLPFTGANLPGFQEQDQRHLNTFSYTWNHTFNGTTFNEFRIGYSRFHYDAVEPVDPVLPSSVGFTGITPQTDAGASYPVISVTGYFTLGFSNNGPQPRIDQTRQLDDNFTKIAGKHTFKAGFNMRRFQVYNPFGARLSGSYSYGGTGIYSTGDPGADYLLGIPDSYAQATGDIIDARAQEYYLNFQDQWKIRPNLTLTWGTGYQIDTPLDDIYHDNHAMTAIRPGQTSTIYPNAPTGYVFQGDPGVNAAGTTKYDHFGPRFGFAWSPGSSGKWSVRGGYGIYFNRTLEEQTLQYLGSPPFGVDSAGVTDYSTSSNALSPSFGDPWTDIAGGGTYANKFPANPSPASNVDFSSYLPMYVYVTDPNLTVPYAQNFNVTVQRQLSTNSIMSVAYVGALGRHLQILRDLNPGSNAAGCLAGVGDEAGCGTTAGSYYQMIYYPQNFPFDTSSFWGIANNQTTGISNYNALQVVFDKHMSHGLALNVNYTWAHAMDNGSGFEDTGFGGWGSIYQRATDPFNQTLHDYGPSSFDARHRFVVSYTYDIPPIHHFDNAVAKRFFEGWRMSGVTVFQSGFALDVGDYSYRSLTYSGTNWTATWDVPDINGSPQYVDPHNSSIVNTTTSASNTTARDHYWFNPNSFTRSAFGTQGNAGRNLLRGPGIANFDWGFYKSTAITESTHLELRFEFYNLFNHTQFSQSGINTGLSSSNFGRESSALDPRIIQLAAKFYF